MLARLCTVSSVYVCIDHVVCGMLSCRLTSLTWALTPSLKRQPPQQSSQQQTSRSISQPRKPRACRVWTGSQRGTKYPTRQQTRQPTRQQTRQLLHEWAYSESSRRGYNIGQSNGVKESCSWGIAARCVKFQLLGGWRAELEAAGVPAAVVLSQICQSSDLRQIPLNLGGRRLYQLDTAAGFMLAAAAISSLVYCVVLVFLVLPRLFRKVRRVQNGPLCYQPQLQQTLSKPAAPGTAWFFESSCRI